MTPEFIAIIVFFAACGISILVGIYNTKEEFPQCSPLEKQIAEMLDYDLIRSYKNVYIACDKLDLNDAGLFYYVSELEYRGLEYELA